LLLDDDQTLSANNIQTQTTTEEALLQSSTVCSIL